MILHHAGLIVCAVILSAFQGPTDTQGRPRAVRTPFAIALQLGRSLPYLLAMTLASGCGEHRAVHLLAVKIVDAILDGARDRGRDKNLRPVIDQQQRTRALTRARLRQTSRSFSQMAA